MPIDLHTILIFIPFMILAAASPGPDVVYVVSRSLGQNRWAGVLAAAGIATGLCVLSASVALGLGEIFTLVPYAYDVMKIAGAAYLLYLAYKILRSKSGATEVEAAAPVALRDVYVQGIFTNLLNPKAILFFMAVLPQFTDPSKGSMTMQLAFIAGLATILGFMTHSIIALAANFVAQRMRRPSPLRAAVQRYVLAGLFGALAVRLALSHRPA